MTQIALGTAQFGMKYGVMNQAGQVARDQVSHILDYADQEGIRLLDTAAAYGDSESILSACINSDADFDIVTKLPNLVSYACEKDIKKIFLDSLEHLGRKNIYAVLLHRADNLLGNNADQVYKALSELKLDGYVSKIGISTYFPQQVFEIFKIFDLDIVQLPLNIFDQRFISSGCIDYLKSNNIEIHVRSVFLQGLLLAKEGKLPSYFDRSKKYFDEYLAFLKKIGINQLQAAVDFIKTTEVDYAIFGVEAVSQLKQIVTAWRVNHSDVNYGALACTDENLLIPSNWKL